MCECAKSERLWRHLWVNDLNNLQSNASEDEFEGVFFPLVKGIALCFDDFDVKKLLVFFLLGVAVSLIDGEDGVWPPEWWPGLSPELVPHASSLIGLNEPPGPKKTKQQKY